MPATIDRDEPPGRGLREPGERPPSARPLERPPSERYRETATARPAPPRGSRLRAGGVGVAVAAVGAAVFAALAAWLSIDWGLLAVAALLGWGVGQGVRLGAAGAVPSPERRRLALVLALAGLSAGEVGLWLAARAQGGVLPLVDHLAQTYGLLVPVEYLVAVVAAWWNAR